MRDIRFAAKIIGKFKSIQSAIFAVVTVLLLSAVLVITGVSMRYTLSLIHIFCKFSSLDTDQIRYHRKTHCSAVL